MLKINIDDTQQRISFFGNSEELLVELGFAISELYSRLLVHAPEEAALLRGGLVALVAHPDSTVWDGKQTAGVTTFIQTGIPGQRRGVPNGDP